MANYQRSTQTLIATLLVTFVSTTNSKAALLDSLVFAHNYESISGDNIDGLLGTPDATKTSNISASTTGTLPFSSQHVQMPNAAVARIDTNTQLTSATNGLSFTTYYNDNGDTSSGGHRFLSTFDGSGSLEGDEFVFDEVSGNLRFITGNPSATTILTSDAAIPKDGNWHQVGFSFNSGTVRFYLDGAPFGSDKVLGAASILTQGNNWFLFEDAPVTNSNHEFYDNGLFDESALWTRVLSDAEMSAVAAQGLLSLVPVPEPATGSLLGLGLLAFARTARARRK